MNVLSELYHDGNYRSYLNTKPMLAVAVVGGDAMKFEQVLLQPSPGRLPVCVTALPSVDAIAPKKTKTTVRTDYFLKSSWCSKHQSQSFSCIVLPLFWDTWEGKREQEKNVLPLLERTKGKVRSLRCKVVVACTTSKPPSPSKIAAFQEATHTMKIILGTHFAGAVLLAENCDDAKSSADLVNTVVNAAVDYHTQEVERLRVKKRDLAMSNRDRGDEVVNAAVARTYFQIGWHLLILEKHTEAVQFFFKACRVCRSMYPRFPPFEARLAVTIFVRQIICALPACGELFTYGSPSHAQVMPLVDWMKSAYPAIDASPRGKKVLRVLQFFLEAEWAEFIATRTENIDAHIRSDLLFSAACALNESLCFLPTTHDKLEIPSPATLGSEYLSDVYTGVVLSSSSQQTVVEKIRSLIEQSSTSTGNARRFDKSIFKSLVLDVSCGDAFRTTFVGGRLGELIEQWPALLTILNGYLYQTALRVLDETDLLEELPEDVICKLLVSGCVDPIRPSTQALFCSVLEKLTLKTPPLEFPHACLLPPVSTIFEFETTECVAATGWITLKISLFTTSLSAVPVENLQVEMHPTQATSGNSTDGIIARCTDNALLVPGNGGMCTTKISLTFPRPGKFVCTKLSCDARIGSCSVPFIFRTEAQAGKTSPPSSLFVSKRNEIVTVRMPPALLTVEGASTLEAVEGETITVTLAIGSTDGKLVNGKLVVPDTTSFFEMETDGPDTQKNSGKPTVTTASAPQMRIHTLPNVDAGAPTLFSITGQCVRSGYFTIPLVFQYESRDGVPVETTKMVRLAIDPPFDVHFSCANSVQWRMDDGMGSTLFPPASTTVHIRRDLNVLEDVSDMLMSSKGLGAKFFYCIRSDSDGVSSTASIPLQEQSAMTVVTTVICRAKNGLTVSKADFVCNDHVELQYVSYGLLPCTLEMGESVTIVAQLRAKKNMENFLPGFVRILFSPRGKVSSRLFTDLGLPAMSVVSMPVNVATSYPPFVTFNQPFVVRISVKNAAASPFQGELILDTRTDLFTLGGRAQWTFLLGPQEEKSTELLLTPLTHGTCALPHFQVRNVANGFIIATNRDDRAVTVL